MVEGDSVWEEMCQAITYANPKTVGDYSPIPDWPGLLTAPSFRVICFSSLGRHSTALSHHHNRLEG